MDGTPALPYVETAASRGNPWLLHQISFADSTQPRTALKTVSAERRVGALTEDRASASPDAIQRGRGGAFIERHHLHGTRRHGMTGWEKQRMLVSPCPARHVMTLYVAVPAAAGRGCNQVRSDGPPGLFSHDRGENGATTNDATRIAGCVMVFWDGQGTVCARAYSAAPLERVVLRQDLPRWLVVKLLKKSKTPSHEATVAERTATAGRQKPTAKAPTTQQALCWLLR